MQFGKVISTLVLLLSLTLHVSAQDKTDKTDKPAKPAKPDTANKDKTGKKDAPPSAEFVTFGTISEIDLKKKTVVLNPAVSFEADKPEAPGPARGGGGNRGGNGGEEGRSGGRRGGGGGGGGGGRGGGGRGGGGRGPSAPIGRVASGNPSTKATITITAATKFMEDEKPIRLEDLGIGDEIEVESAKGGSKIDAIDVIRLSKADLELPNLPKPH